MGNHSSKEEDLNIESSNAIEEIALEKVCKERYGIFYIGLDIEGKSGSGQLANKIHLKKGKPGKGQKTTKNQGNMNKSTPHTVRYGIFYDSLKDEAVIIDMQNNN